MSNKQILYCQFGSDSDMECNKVCKYYKTCTRNPHNAHKEKQTRAAGKTINNIPNEPK